MLVVGSGEMEEGGGGSVWEKLLCSSKEKLSLHITLALWKRRGGVGDGEGEEEGRGGVACTTASLDST